MKQTQRGLGRIYQPKFKDRKTGETRTSPTWWLDFYAYDPAQQRRRKYRESSGTTNKSDAMKLLKQRNGDVAAGKPIIDAARVTFPDLTALLVTDYELNQRRGLVRMKIASKRLAETFGNLRAIDITAPRVDAYIKARLVTMKPATVHVELAALKRMLALAVHQKLLPSVSKLRSLTFENARTGFFERAEYETLLTHLPPYAQPVVTFLYFTGWRISEVLALTWPQIDFNAGTIRLEPGTTKNKQGRSYPLSAEPTLLAMLTRQREHVAQIEKQTARITPNVFVRDDGKPIRDIRSIWRTACQRAGLVGRIPHDFRRTAVRNMERAGVPRSVAMTLTGHRTEAVYRRYAIVKTSDQATWVQKLAQQHAEEHAAAVNASPVVVPIASVAKRAKLSDKAAQ